MAESGLATPFMVLLSRNSGELILLFRCSLHSGTAMCGEEHNGKMLS
jgi:hypothetical protein